MSEYAPSARCVACRSVRSTLMWKNAPRGVSALNRGAPRDAPYPFHSCDCSNCSASGVPVTPLTPITMAAWRAMMCLPRGCALHNHGARHIIMRFASFPDVRRTTSPRSSPYKNLTGGIEMKLTARAAVAAFTALLAAAPPGEAAGQAFPNKPGRLFVTYAPGGGADLVSRPIAPKMNEGLGQQG